jgi:hypothetical protein
MFATMIPFDKIEFCENGFIHSKNNHLPFLHRMYNTPLIMTDIDIIEKTPQIASWAVCIF